MKSHFPIINYFEKKHIIYADSAATTLKLKTVIDSVSNFYSFETSNVFRGCSGCLHAIGSSVVLFSFPRIHRVDVTDFIISSQFDMKDLYFYISDLMPT